MDEVVVWDAEVDSEVEDAEVVITAEVDITRGTEEDRVDISRGET